MSSDTSNRGAIYLVGHGPYRQLDRFVAFQPPNSKQPSRHHCEHMQQAIAELENTNLGDAAEL
jgi:hypothetical protein